MEFNIWRDWRRCNCSIVSSRPWRDERCQTAALYEATENQSRAILSQLIKAPRTPSRMRPYPKYSIGIQRNLLCFSEVSRLRSKTTHSGPQNKNNKTLV